MIYLATIKGSPWTYHLKREGQSLALCGHTYGKGRRAGWYSYSAIPNMVGEHLCKKCEAAAPAAGVKVVNGEVVTA